jgi:hypothetical protein
MYASATMEGLLTVTAAGTGIVSRLGEYSTEVSPVSCAGCDSS